MWQGTVESLHIVEAKSQPMRTVATVRAIAGLGLEGDRYTLEAGTYSDRPEVGRQTTLFEAETLEALARDLDIRLAPEQCRRNVITRGVPANHLVGRRLRIGAVVLEGMRLCQPCQYLEDLLGIPSLFKALMHRGGLNCRIVEGGEIRVGDEVGPG